MLTANLLAIALFCNCFVEPVAAPTFSVPQAIPAERILGNLLDRLRRDPENFQITYQIARVHYLVLANRCLLIPAYRRLIDVPREIVFETSGRSAIKLFITQLRWDEATRLARDAGAVTEEDLEARRAKEMEELVRQNWLPARPTAEEIENHATEAARFFDLAIQLEPDDILAHLGRASFREQCLQFELSGLLPRRRVIEGLEKVTLEDVRDEYFFTFQKALSINVKRESLVGDWKETVCHEAGTAYLRLVAGNPALANEQEDRISEVEAGLETLEQIPVGFVTPIIVGSEGKAYEDLLDGSTHRVMFDLDGDGRTERWPWVKEDTGILVWDPMRTGRIQSGRQMFGSVTFGLFHENGYTALDLLDDDHDGYIDRRECDGLAIWYDRNRNGTSESGEVIPVGELGVTRIATGATMGSAGVLESRSGVEYENGTTAPTFDWICHPTGS